MSRISSCNVVIEDHGDKRIVTIDGPRFDMAGLRQGGETFETFYSREVIELLHRLKGSQYLKDEIDRGEEPAYIRFPLEATIRPIVDPKGKAILDFGSGCGASSINLCRIGADNVHGVEINKVSVEIAHLRARDCGLEKSITFHYVEDSASLGFEAGSFDIILADGVFEHIPPKERPRHFREIWRVLKPGGFLFIIETPNSVWPVDSHTTGLPFVPYLPLRLARQYAVIFSRRVSSEDTVEDLLIKGMRGVSYWELRRALKGFEVIANDDVNRFFRLALSKPQPKVRKKMIRLLRCPFKVLDATICKLFRIPVAALLPNLSLCIRKS